MLKRLLFMVLFVFCSYFHWASADTEFWSANTFQFHYKEKIKLNLIPELRLKNSASELYYFQTYNFRKRFFDEGRSSLGYSAKLFDNLEVSLGYILRRQKPQAGDDWQRTSIISAGIKYNL